MEIVVFGYTLIIIQKMLQYKLQIIIYISFLKIVNIMEILKV